MKRIIVYLAGLWPTLLKYALMMLDIVSPYRNFVTEICVYMKCFGMTVVMSFLLRE